LSPDEQDLALSVAQHALQARGLAQVDINGQPQLHRALLSSVAACAYPQRTTLVEHWQAGGTGSHQIYAHTRDDASVIHTADGGLHTFVLFPSEAALIEHLAGACEWDGVGSASSLELTVPRADFTRACDASAAGDEKAAVQALGGENQAGSALAQALGGRPQISIVQTLRANAAEEQSFTVIGGKQAWLVAPVSRDPNAQLKARTVSRSELAKTLLS
jgi:hypothetical protein